MPVKLPPKQRSNLFSFSLKTLGAAMATALLLSNASAAGLGKLTVLSALGQPLNAEIELSAVSKEEAAGLVPKLAPPEAFRQANIELHPSLLGLRFAIEQRGNKQIIRVTSAQAMNEPFVDMLLEVGVPNGRLVREYTFLLDPPDVRTPQSAQVAATGAGTAPPAAPTEARLTLSPTPTLTPLTPAAKPVAPATPAAAPVAVAQYRPAPAVMPPAPPALPSPAREVRRGDTLSQIARENLTEGVSLDQMLVALYRSNPDAFIGKNMNRLRTGTILTVPDASTATATSAGEARRIVLAQANNFNEYRNQLAGQVANADAKAAADSSTTSSGKVTAKVADATAAADEARDKLKLSKSTAGNAADKAVAPGDSAEDKIARDKALGESAARVKDLERIVSDLQKVAEMKNKDLAERQKLAEAEQARAAAATTAAAAVSSAAAALPGAQPKTDVAAQKPAASVPAAPAKAPATPAPANLLDNPMVLPGAGILLVLLGSLGFMAARRKRLAQQSEEHDFSEAGLESNSIFAAPGGKHIDTSNSIFNSSFAASSDKSITSEVDPVAEADVYIAYGRDAQAEEILKEALRVNPERHPVRVKLLEIYASRKDVATFAALAVELHDMTGGEGEQWQQAAALGSGIDPENLLYAASDAASDDDVTVNVPDARGALDVTPVVPAGATGTALDFYAGEPGKTVSDDAPAEPPVFAAEAITPSILASNIDEINFDFLDEGQEKPAPAKPASAMTAADLESEFALIEAALAKSGDVSPAPAPVPLEFDLSEITLDLSPADVAAAKADADVPALPTLDGAAEFDLDVSDDANNSEMVTKLDLAAAYEEIGDNDGARELLEEVVSGGNEEQVAKARASLARLA